MGSVEEGNLLVLCVLKRVLGRCFPERFYSIRQRSNLLFFFVDYDSQDVCVYVRSCGFWSCES